MKTLDFSTLSIVANINTKHKVHVNSVRVATHKGKIYLRKKEALYHMAWIIIDYEDHQKQQISLHGLSRSIEQSLFSFFLATHSNNLNKKTWPQTSYTFYRNPRICIGICFNPLFQKSRQTRVSLQRSEMS
jgi:hypothetical protein